MTKGQCEQIFPVNFSLRQLLRDLCRKRGAEKSHDLDSDHQIPTGGAIRSSNRFDDLDLVMGLALSAAHRPRHGHAVEPRPGHCIGRMSWQPSLALRVVRAVAKHWNELARAGKQFVAIHSIDRL